MTSKRAKSADQTSFGTTETPGTLHRLPMASAVCYRLRRSRVHLLGGVDQIVQMLLQGSNSSIYKQVPAMISPFSGTTFYVSSKDANGNALDASSLRSPEWFWLRSVTGML